MTSFDIKLFGAIEIYRDGESITNFRSQKALALLAYLITEGRPVTREYLAGLAWPEATQTQALGLLRRSLYSLSRQLPDCLEANQRTVSFKHDAPATIDTRQFAHLAAQDDEAVCVQAAALFRAPFLEGVYLADCPIFEQWLITEQQRWQDKIDGLLARLIQIFSDQGDYATALTYATRRLTLAPWHEETHRQVMRLHLYNGQRSAALAQYDRCVAVLADELGVDPAPATQALYEQIKQAAPYPPHNLPPQATPFLGRQTELTELTRLIANPNQRLLTLVGPGGMGKTRLAIAAAERQLGRPTETADPASPTYAFFTHGVYLANLTAIETATGLVPAIAEALNFQLETDAAQRTPKQQLLDYLREKRLLLLLDNFEQLLSTDQATTATGLLLEILQVAPEVQLLVTSRERLQVAAEQVYPVHGLAYPDTLTDVETAVCNYSALALFTRIAQHLRPDFRCEGETAASMAQICQTVWGMPLAIELAAATITILSPAEILTELTHSLDLLTTTTRHITARHRSIRAAFETSWRQLSPAEQAVFQKLSVFRSGFIREAAQAVANASQSMLAALVNKSFIRYRPITQRYEIHELMRQFGAEKLGQSAEQVKLSRQKHSIYFAARLAQWANEIKGVQQQATCQAMMAENENIRQAWQWIVDERQLALLAQAIDGPALFYQWQGRYQEGVEFYQSACQMLREEVEGWANHLPSLIKALTWQGILTYGLGQRQSAITLFEDALSYGEKNRPEVDPPQSLQTGQALLWQGLGNALVHTSRSKAKHYFEQSLAVYEALEDIWGVSQAYYGLSGTARGLGDYALANDLAQKSLDLRQAIGDQRGMADSLGVLGLIMMDMGELDQAETFGRRKLALFRNLNNPPGIASSLVNLGLLDLFLGLFEAGQRKFEESLAIFNDLGDQLHSGETYIWLGIARCMQGHYRQALSEGQIGLALMEDAGSLYNTGHARMLVSYLKLVLGGIDEARVHAQASLDIFEQLGQRGELSQAWVWMSYAELVRGQITAAQTCLARCLQLALEVGTFLPVLEALPASARLLCLQEEPELAIEIYALAMTYPVLAKAALIEDLAGKYITVAAEILPPADVTAIQARGRQRDLWETAAELLEKFAASISLP